MNTQEMIEWLTVQAADAKRCMDTTDYERSPRAYGYWQGIYEAHTNSLRNLTNK